MGKYTGSLIDVAIRKLRVKSQYIPFNWTSSLELKPSPSMWIQSYGK